MLVYRMKDPSSSMVKRFQGSELEKIKQHAWAYQNLLLLSFQFEPGLCRDSSRVPKCFHHERSCFAPRLNRLNGHLTQNYLPKNDSYAVEHQFIIGELLSPCRDDSSAAFLYVFSGKSN